MVETTEKQLETPTGLAELTRAFATGVLLVKPDGAFAAADEPALALLACRERGELARRWEEIGPHVKGAGPEPFLLPVGPAGRPVLFAVRRPAAPADPAGGTVVLVRDPEALADALADLRLAAYFRALAQISPAVAHDLRAPINAMVFNIEILKETLAASRALEPAARDRQLRYVSVLRDELTRLHTGLEQFLSHTSGRGDKTDSVDLKEMLQELAALLVAQARKIQVQVVPELPEQPVAIQANRFQLRQALLEIGSAALSGMARGGTLTIRLESGDRGAGGAGGNHRARILFRGPSSAEAPALDFDLAPGAAPAGRARLHPARAILAEQGGRLTVEGGAPGERSFEVELPISGKE